jgi:hypothetical protein
MFRTQANPRTRTHMVDEPRTNTLVADILVRRKTVPTLEIDTVRPTDPPLSSNLTATLAMKSANSALALVPADTTPVVIIVWGAGAGAVAAKVSLLVVVRELVVVVATKRAAGSMVIVDPTRASALEPAEERDKSSIMDELARTIVGSQAALARVDIEVTSSMDEDGFDVRSTLREEVGSDDMALTSNKRSPVRIVRALTL